LEEKMRYGYVFVAIVTVAFLSGCGLQGNDECEGGRCLDVVCGDGTCDSSESCETCAGDCGACPVEPECGDGVCNGDETCNDCSDCGACAPVCGDGVCEDPECASSCPADCEEECEDCGPLPDPFQSPAPYTFLFSAHYVSGATCGEVRGNLPSMSWDSGYEIVDLYEGEMDGWLGFAYDTDEIDVAAGMYDFSYVGYQSCVDDDPLEAWAQYGLLSDLLRVSETGRSFILCDWYDASRDACVAPADGSPSCNIRVQIDADGNVTPYGNMAGLNADSVGC